MRKSIGQGKWERIVLLPSLVTEQYAAELQARCGDFRVEVQPLPTAGLEDDTDACFAHFDRVIAALREEGYQAADIVADFTRGAKAMSAALVLAAIRHDLTTLRYITGPRDDRHSMVRAGKERIFEISPAIAIARKRLDTAHQFTLRGNFAGALALLEDDDAMIGRWPPLIAATLPALREVLRFHAAWDRLDYRSAEAISCPDAAPLREWQAAWPTPAMPAWVARLAAPVVPADHAAMAARLLKILNDPIASSLLGFDDKRPVWPRVSARYVSVLIHGFQAVGPDDDAQLRGLYRDLALLVVMDAGEAAKMALRTARQAGFPSEPSTIS